jgi:D-alanyl-D-alanine carboxypeptidase/D-alanyl-D-alanine-endopeptidase (penicillin-binding protein 4)
MRSTLAVPLIAFLAACARTAVGPAPATNERAALRFSIDSMLAAPDVRQARWGLLIVDPERGDTLYSRDAGKLMVPASNMKILTSAVALDALGPEFVFETTVLMRGARHDSTIRVDLLIAGRGDPSVSDRMMGDAMIPLRAMADSLWDRGVRRVVGRIAPHGNAFPDANAGFGWAWEDFETSSGAFIDELLFNEGISDVRVWAGAAPGESVRASTSPATTYPRVRIEATTTVRGTGRDSVAQLDIVKDTARGEVVLTGTIPAGDSARLVVTHSDPALAYVAALREALAERGIQVLDSSVADTTTVPLFRVRSAPMPAILAAFMKPSQNQIGEMLLKSVALQRTDTGTARVGRRVVGERLLSWGAEADGFLVFDGSGLSRRNLVTAETVVRVLDAMRKGPYFTVYYDAFPVAGVDGTVRGRMRGTAAEANLRGKTGTLGNVRSLSGYVTTASGRHLIFSILCNNYTVPTDYISRVQDVIGARLAAMRSLN